MGQNALSIRVVASQTGIPADTLRMWERRYGFPNPERRAGGSRLYGEADVTRLQLIARARDAGYRPGDVIELSDRDITKLLDGSKASLTLAHPAPAIDLDSLISALARDEVARVRSSLRSLAITLGPKAFVTDIAQPLAVRIGEAWQRGTIEVRHEHLATALLSAQLRLLTATFDDAEETSGPTVILATLPGEAHALPLEMVALYLTAAHRATVHLLGADTPPDEIARAAKALQATVVGVSISTPNATTSTARDVDRLRRELPRRTTLWLGGAGASSIAEPSARVRLTTSWSLVDDAVAKL